STQQQPRTTAAAFSPFFVGAATQGPQVPTALALLPVPRLNAIFVVAPEARLDDVKAEIRKLDRPLAANVRATTIQLKRASAVQVATLLNNFYTARFSENNQVRISFDASINAVIVQAAPSDLTEITNIIRSLDTKESSAVNEIKIIQLKNVKS